MNQSTDINLQLNKIADVLIRCFVIAIFFLAIWFALMVFADQLIYKIHSTWYDISKPQFDMLWYAGMGLIKLWIFMFFLIPYIAIKLAIKR